MKACGVIVEYNPFHNGHLYHIKTARKKSQADVVIAVMSGIFCSEESQRWWINGKEQMLHWLMVWI